DMHTLAVTYDGKYVVGVFSGYQKTASGIVIMDTRTDEVLGILPSVGGHHDCVIVPKTLEDLRCSRCTTT
ncbi:YncE family protein, partial [Pelomicrobium sp. G1]